MSNQKLQPVRVLNEKGMVLFIAPHLLTPQYMHRHKLVRTEIEEQEELKPIEQVNLTVLKEKVEAVLSPIEPTPTEPPPMDDLPQAPAPEQKKTNKK